MAKKKGFKLDTTQLKQFLVAKGERVGLIVSAGLMVLLLLWGIMMGLGTGSDHGELQKTAQSKLGQVRNSNKEPPPEIVTTGTLQGPKNAPAWDQMAADKYPLMASFFDPGAITEDKVFNPYALMLVGADKPLDERGDFIKLDVVRAPVKFHTVTIDNMVEILKPPSGGAESQTVHVANDVKPHRLIVVSALFPYHDQLEVYKKFLRKNSLKEITSDEKLAPKFLGLDVVRCEVQGGQMVNFDKLFVYDPALKTLEVKPQWKSFLQNAKFDTKAYQKVKTFVVAGLATPMPELADGSYPDYVIDAKGLKVAKGSQPKEGPGGTKDPMKPGLPGLPTGGLPDGSDNTSKPAPGGTIDVVSLAELEKTNKSLAKKLAGEFNIFDPYGEEKKPAAGPGGPGGPGVGGPGPGVGPGNPPMAPGDPKGPGMGDEKPMPDGPDGDYKGPENLLVRFVDPTVQPGKTYKYFIQVRLENPNFGKKEKVAYPALAEVKELFSGWTETPSQYVEEEYFYYVVDQLQLDPPKTNHPGTKDLDLNPTNNKKDELVAVQIHRWVEEGEVAISQLKGQKIGGWAVAERMLVKKGQYIGKKAVEISLPYWKKTHEAFEMPAPKKNAKNQPIVKAVPGHSTTVQEFTGMIVDLQPPTAPLVVDFKGGEADYWYYNPQDKNSYVKEKAAVQLLVLSPDGKLLSFNSRDDSEDKTVRGKQRLEHYQHWQAMLKGPAAKTTGGTPPGPGPK